MVYRLHTARMNSTPNSLDQPNLLSADWQQQAQQRLQEGFYSEAAHFYEQAIALDPEQPIYYWHLGLLRMLQGEEAEAQTIWFMALSQSEENNLDQWTADLVQILDTEAERREALLDYDIAWVIRQHIREIVPGEIKNLLHLVWVGIQQNNLTADELRDLGVIQALQADPKPVVEFGRVLQVLDQVLKFFPPDPVLLEFTEACLGLVDNLTDLTVVVLSAAVKIAYERRYPKLAAHLLEVYRPLDPENLDMLGHLSTFYQNAYCFNEGIAVAQDCYDSAQAPADKLYASHILLRALMSAGGHWQTAIATLEQHKQLMTDLIAHHPTNLDLFQVTRLFTASGFLPYFQDDLKGNRTFQNQIMALCQENLQLQARDRVERYRISHQTLQHAATKQPLRIGYLSHCMGRHSVGWLARWLIQYHDRSQVQLFGYFINESKNDPLHDWYKSQMDTARCFSIEAGDEGELVADQICEDNIQVLIDLDSLTLDLSCHILSLKPAPIQVSWLGWDAPGLPAIDYFITDPYVLPDWAQNFYSEKIWQLPQTYIAVDGFEVDIPSLRRDQLGIPADAVVFLSAQKGYKRHIETARLQMKIIKAVPNSYFLIKGQADQALMKQFFEELAEAEGIHSNRLCFLPETAKEATHRADLTIADVVLDTYPYNGATTTLETLWMGVPLVTRVGDQFAARNSYTMLKNVGIEEGIAWSDQEYIDWGIRFGTNATLRQHVHWKLQQSRGVAPLWNAKQFARDMENAYHQMWALYRETP
jgi:predicted O-linked N-acetylglucosamine transferase (SPINDLY family)